MGKRLSEYRPTAATLRKYGLTLHQWLSLWEAQDGRCYLCERVFSRSRVPCVDHDHKSGLVRGLLCSPCNNDLGVLHERRSWFVRAARYLRRPPAIKVIGHVYVPNSRGAAT